MNQATLILLISCGFTYYLIADVLTQQLQSCRTGGAWRDLALFRKSVTIANIKCFVGRAGQQYSSVNRVGSSKQLILTVTKHSWTTKRRLFWTSGQRDSLICKVLVSVAWRQRALQVSSQPLGSNVHTVCSVLQTAFYFCNRKPVTELNQHQI